VNETGGVTDAASGNTTNGTEQSFMQTYDTGTFLASMWTNIALVTLWFLLWNGLRRVVKAVYEPRTYIPPRDQQAPPLGTHWLKPIWRILMGKQGRGGALTAADPKEILHKNGVDPYVFVRFLRLLMKAMIPIWLVSWVVLLPVNSVGGPNRTGLDMFAMSNANHEPRRYWAHLCNGEHLAGVADSSLDHDPPLARDEGMAQDAAGVARLAKALAHRAGQHRPHHWHP
jgi:hypothetical protein